MIRTLSRAGIAAVCFPLIALSENPPTTSANSSAENANHILHQMLDDARKRNDDLVDLYRKDALARLEAEKKVQQLQLQLDAIKDPPKFIPPPNSLHHEFNGSQVYTVPL